MHASGRLKRVVHDKTGPPPAPEDSAKTSCVSMEITAGGIMLVACAITGAIPNARTAHVKTTFHGDETRRVNKATINFIDISDDSQLFMAAISQTTHQP